jgi:hypothetical protein
MTAFCIQEFTISGIYAKEVVGFLHIVTQKGVRRTMWELFTINVILVALDVGLLVIEYLNLSVFEIKFKGGSVQCEIEDGGGNIGQARLHVTIWHSRRLGRP